MLQSNECSEDTWQLKDLQDHRKQWCEWEQIAVQKGYVANSAVRYWNAYHIVTIFIEVIECCIGICCKCKNRYPALERGSLHSRQLCILNNGLVKAWNTKLRSTLMLLPGHVNADSYTSQQVYFIYPYSVLLILLGAHFSLLQQDVQECVQSWAMHCKLQDWAGLREAEHAYHMALHCILAWRHTWLWCIHSCFYTCWLPGKWTAASILLLHLKDHTDSQKSMNTWRPLSCGPQHLNKWMHILIVLSWQYY